MKIGRNVIFNLVGFALPVVVLLFSYRLLLRGLGVSQFGILALAMSVAAALSFLDFGLAAAALRFVVSDIHAGRPSSAGRVMTTSITFFGALGLLITVVVFLLSPYLAMWLGVAGSDQVMAIKVFKLTALQIGITLALNAIAGLFKALDRFDISAVMSVALAVLANAIPAIQVYYFSESLPTVQATVAVTLTVFLAIMALTLSRVSLKHGIRLSRTPPDIATFKRTFAFGVTLTIHGLIGMLFTHGQRLLVGALFGPIPVASFQLSMTLVSKVHAAVNAAAEVALPFATSNRMAVVRRAYMRGVIILGLFSFAPLLIIAVFNEQVIRVWLGHGAPPFAAQLLPTLCIAYFFVAISALPYHVLNGVGRPGINVAFAVFNFLVYAAAIGVFELEGARSLQHVAIAYAISNAVCGVGYQIFCIFILNRLAGEEIMPAVDGST